MTVLIIGTPDSGKSQKAEEIALSLSRGKKKYYIATMIPFGEEGKLRVKKHLKLRDGKGFATIEKPVDVHELTEEIPDLKESTCLLECMSNLIGNEMHREGAADLQKLPGLISGSVMSLAQAAENLVIVTNRFPMDDPDYDEDTLSYVKLVAAVNDDLKRKADRAYEPAGGEWKISENI